MSADDLVIQQLADQVVELEERLAVTQSYRAALQVALEQLAERNRELEASRRQNAALVAELRVLRAGVAA